MRQVTHFLAITAVITDLIVSGTFLMAFKKDSLSSSKYLCVICDLSMTYLSGAARAICNDCWFMGTRGEDGIAIPSRNRNESWSLRNGRPNGMDEPQASSSTKIMYERHGRIAPGRGCIHR